MLAARGQTPREVMQVNSNVQYVNPGYLMFVRDGTLLAQRFDATTGRVSGDPVAIADPVNYFRSTAIAHFSASRGGVVAYQSHTDVAHLAWFDRAGTETVMTTMPPAGYLDLRMSADGREVLLPRLQPGIGTYDLWRLDVTRGVNQRMTSDPGNDIDALWVPGRPAIVYGRGTPPHMVIRDEPTGAESPVTPGTDFQGAQDITPDGQWLAYTQRGSNGTFGLFVLRLTEGADRTPSGAYDSPFEHGSARFSPDGHWLAFVAADSGQPEVYVAPFPATGRKEQRLDARRQWAALEPGRPRAVFHLEWRVDGRADDGRALRRRAGPRVQTRAPMGRYDVSPDRRFLAIVPDTFASQQPMTVIVNWLAKLQ